MRWLQFYGRDWSRSGFARCLEGVLSAPAAEGRARTVNRTSFRGANMRDEDETRADDEPELRRLPRDNRKSSALSSGEVLADRYRIERLIDGGGMGDVYRAFDMKVKGPVALKRIKPDLLRDPQFRQRVGLEVHASAVINHPGVAKGTDLYDDSDEMMFIIYEFVEGETLYSLLGQRRFALGQILDIGIEIGGALVAAHAKGFVHRDLKPKNIMLTPQPDGSSHIKILDFGLAKKVKVYSQSVQREEGGTAFEDLSTKSTAMVIGTPDYMSPEQAAAEPVDARTDIYSLGLTLYEMTAGFNPFASGGDSDSARRRVLNMEVPPLPHLDSLGPNYAELDRILRRCLRKRPEDRYASVQELIADLTKLRDLTRGSIVWTDGPPTPIPRWLACFLFTVIQIGYLVMYATASYYLPENTHRLPKFIQDLGVTRFVMGTLVLLCAAATVRIYLLAAAAFDYEDLGRLFHRIFPLVLIMDLVWALSPLLLFLKAGFILIMGVPALALLPFSQRYLITCAYGRQGGRSSGARPSGPPDRGSGPGTGARPSSFPPTPPTSWITR